MLIMLDQENNTSTVTYHSDYMIKSDKGFVFCVTPLEIYMFSFVFAFRYKNLLFRLNSSYII